MNFTEAFKAMKAGKRVKRPKWEGYWEWDEDVCSILICHVFSNNAIYHTDIRKLCGLEGSVLDMQQDDWIIATKENCIALGGKKTFSFADAIEHLKHGYKVTRLGWNGENQHIQLVTDFTCKTKNGVVIRCDGADAIAFVSESGTQMGWLASQADMLADDWVFAE